MAGIGRRDITYKQLPRQYWDVICPPQQPLSAIQRGPPRDVHHTVCSSDIEYPRCKIYIRQMLPIVESVSHTLTHRAQRLFNPFKAVLLVSNRFVEPHVITHMNGRRQDKHVDSRNLWRALREICAATDLSRACPMGCATL